jgi:hypothetical protein
MSASALTRRQRVRDRNGAAAGAEKRVVVLRVADADDIERRQTQSCQRRRQAARLVHTGRQHHDSSLVEDDLQLQPQIPDHVQDDLFVRLPGRDDAAADR